MIKWFDVVYVLILKRIMDVVLSALLFMALSPLFLVLFTILRLQGPNAIFAHSRVGRGGRVFQCYKFRTMVPDAERVLRQLLESDPVALADWLRDHKLRDDPRITRIGAFLRKTSLDELPQLWNVVCGDMSIVGPRPIVEAELTRYGIAVNEYLSVRPGLTGLWQVSGRNDVSYDERVALDKQYAHTLGLFTDLSILVRTPVVILFARGAY